MLSPTAEEARVALEEHLSEVSLTHCERVGATAAALAAVCSVDPELALLAGLLHDWSRDMPEDALLTAARTLGIEITEEDAALPYLLHPRVGAGELRKRFPRIPEEVLAAVRAHTVGAREMSALDKVVYVADMVEPERSYEGLEELREAIGEVSLDELFRRAYSRSLEHLIERRRRIHEETVVVWNSHVAGSLE